MRAFRLSRRALLASGAALSWLPAAPAIAQVAKRELRLGLITPDNHTWNQQLAKLNDELQAESGGQLSILVFPAGQLGSDAAMIQQLQTGALDLGLITVPELSNRVVDFAALMAPFLARDVAHAAKILRHPLAESVLTKLPAIGMVGLGYAMTGMRQIYAREPISSAADLRGKKIRIIPATPFRDFYALVGVTPTPVSFPQVYDALANSQIDAIDMDFEGTTVYRFYDHLKQMRMTNHFMFAGAAVASNKIWSELPAPQRDLLGRLIRKHMDIEKDVIVAQELAFLEQLKKTKLEIVPTPPSFFGDIPGKWDQSWGGKSPLVAEVRRASATL